MEHRVLDITVISAEGLKNIDIISDIDLYVSCWISGGQGTEKITRSGRRVGSSLEWNQRMKFPVAKNDMDKYAIFQLESERILGERDQRVIGYVFISLLELLKGAAGERVVELKVHDHSGNTTDATLKLSYRFDEQYFIVRAPPPQGKGCAPPSRPLCSMCSRFM